MECRTINVDPCMYLKWKEIGMLVYLALNDDCACFGRDYEVCKLRNKMMKLFDCDDVGNINKYFE